MGRITRVGGIILRLVALLLGYCNFEKHKISHMRLFFASQNQNKIKEIRSVIPPGIEIDGIDEFIHEELEETGDTLEKNALQKARFVAAKTGLPAFADDTGLEIDALNGAPGVYSARYAGEEKSASANIEKVLLELSGIHNRNARFRTVIAFVNGTQECIFEGTVEGTIANDPAGNGGFGYDPVFMPNGSNKTFAEMDLAEKNTMSHRARAVAKFVAFLATKD